MTFIIYVVSYLTFVLASVIAFEDAHVMPQNMGNILCRNCGGNVTSTGSLISKSSPKARYSFNDTLFYKDEVLVQVFATDVFFHYPLVSFAFSTCVPTGEKFFDCSLKVSNAHNVVLSPSKRTYALVFSLYFVLSIVL